MKKTVKNLVPLIIVILLAGFNFTSCDKDDDSGKGKNALEKNYFSIENASFVNKTLPSGSADLITDFSINKSVITGGSSILSFTSSEALQTVYVGVEGVAGYYEYNLENNLKAATADYNYEIVLLLSQTISVENFAITISARAVSGSISSAVNLENIEVIEVGTGKLQVSLTWDQLDDVDLHLFEPDGTEICYWNSISSDGIDSEKLTFEFMCAMVTKYTSHNASTLNYQNERDWEILAGYTESLPYSFYENYETEYQSFLDSKDLKIWGELDLDSNAGCSIDAINNENITFEKNVKKGTYIVAVDLYEKCDSSKPGAKYSITVAYNGQFITISNKQIGKFSDDFGGSYDNYDEFVIIGAFTIDNNGNLKVESVPTSLRSSLGVRESIMNSIQKKAFKNIK